MATVDNAIAPLARITPATWKSETSTARVALHQIRRAVALESIDIDTALQAAGIPHGVRAPRTTVLFQNYASGLSDPPQAEALRLDPQRSFSREASASDASIVFWENPDTMGVRIEFWPAVVNDATAQRVLREIHRQIRRMVAEHV